MINNNIIPFGGFADPHALVENGKVYIFSGSDKSYKTEDTWRMDKWCIFESSNIKDWKKVGEILPEDTYIGNCHENCWAGYPLKKGNKFYWFFSNKSIDIGVAVADCVTGPYKDILHKPLIAEGFAPTKSYDPCVYEENGEYTIFFGAGKYYCATLSDDLMSIVSEPQPIVVKNKEGKEVGTSDKSTVFKRNGKYYLCYGDRYAMSDKLKGPYLFMGDFIGGGHNDIFVFNGEYYICNEFHDTSIFYRGIRVDKLEFNEDGTVKLQKDDAKDVSNCKIWDFTKGSNNWFLSDFNDVQVDEVGVKYNLNSNVSFRSPAFPGVFLLKNNKLKLQFNNIKSENDMLVVVERVDAKGGYWNNEGIVEQFNLHISPNKNEYIIDFSLDNEQYVTKKISIIGTQTSKNEMLSIKRISINKE